MSETLLNSRDTVMAKTLMVSYASWRGREGTLFLCPFPKGCVPPGEVTAPFKAAGLHGLFLLPDLGILFLAIPFKAGASPGSCIIPCGSLVPHLPLSG